VDEGFVGLLKDELCSMNSQSSLSTVPGVRRYCIIVLSKS